MVHHTFNAAPCERLQQHPLRFTTNRTMFFLWRLHLARPGHRTILLRWEAERQSTQNFTLWQQQQGCQFGFFGGQTSQIRPRFKSVGLKILFGLLWPHLKLFGLKKLVWAFYTEKVSTEEKHYYSIFSATRLQIFCNKCYEFDRRPRSDVGKIWASEIRKKCFCVITGNVCTV